MNKNYSYKVEDFRGGKVIIIEDQSHISGGKTVVNNIEKIIDDIELTEIINADDCIIVIGDHTGNWDGWDNKTQQFEILEGTNAYHAINRWKKRLNDPSLITHHKNQIMTDPNNAAENTAGAAEETAETTQSENSTASENAEENADTEKSEA